MELAAPEELPPERGRRGVAREGSIDCRPFVCWTCNRYVRWVCRRPGVAGHVAEARVTEGLVSVCVWWCVNARLRVMSA